MAEILRTFLINKENGPLHLGYTTKGGKTDLHAETLKPGIRPGPYSVEKAL